jgi:hypothetical protein
MTDDERDAALRFDQAIYEEACGLASSSPLDLNEAHFDQLAIISKHSAARAREARRQAQLDIVTKAATAPAPRTSPAAPAPPETMEAFLQKHGKEPATYRALYDAAAALLEISKALKTKWDEMNERNKERNARLDALEARLLELEATAAAQKVETR